MTDTTCLMSANEFLLERKHVLNFVFLQEGKSVCSESCDLLQLLQIAFPNLTCFMKAMLELLACLMQETGIQPGS